MIHLPPGPLGCSAHPCTRVAAWGHCTQEPAAMLVQPDQFDSINTHAYSVVISGEKLFYADLADITLRQ